MGTFADNVHVQVFGKLGLTAGAALLGTFVFVAAQHPMNLYAGFPKDLRDALLGAGENGWGHPGVVKKGDRESVGGERWGNLGRSGQKQRGK